MNNTFLLSFSVSTALMLACGSTAAAVTTAHAAAATNSQLTATIATEQIDDDGASAKVILLTRPTKLIYCDYDYDMKKGVEKSKEVIEAGYYRYYGESKKYYFSFIGNGISCVIPKKYGKIETWTAAEGHGWVFFRNDNRTPIELMAAPSASSETLEVFPNADDYGYPDDAVCLGVEGDWYKVDYYGCTGYVKAKDVEWSIGSVDAAGSIR